MFTYETGGSATYVHHVMFPRVQATGAYDGTVEPAMDPGTRYAQEHASVEAAPLGICNHSRTERI